jgi:hypothetical protein
VTHVIDTHTGHPPQFYADKLTPEERSASAEARTKLGLSTKQLMLHVLMMTKKQISSGAAQGIAAGSKTVGHDVVTLLETSDVRRVRTFATTSKNRVYVLLSVLPTMNRMLLSMLLASTMSLMSVV